MLDNVQTDPIGYDLPMLHGNLRRFTETFPCAASGCELRAQLTNHSPPKRQEIPVCCSEMSSGLMHWLLEVDYLRIVFVQILNETTALITEALEQ